MAFNIKPGDIIIVNNFAGSFLSKAIRFFTNSWSHTALGFFDFPRKPSQQMMLEANLLVTLSGWDKDDENTHIDLRVYRWKKKNIPDKILWEMFDTYNGNVYGWWQLLYFVWRWIVEKLSLPRRWALKNFFPNDEICTEIVYVALTKINDPVVNAALARLSRDQNTVHPGDIISICEDLCKAGVLEMVYNRER